MSLAAMLSRHWLPLLLVAGAHAALLTLLGAPLPPPAPPVLEVALLPAAPVPPLPAAPRPAPALRPVPRTEARARPVAVPAPAPSPAPAAPTPAAPAPAPVAEAAAAPAPAEPVVTPPRLDASYRGNAMPAYPTLSRRLGEEGTVLLRLFVKEDGTVGEVELRRSSGFSRLDQAAIETVRRWRLIPARRGSEPFATWYTLPLEFNLEN